MYFQHHLSPSLTQKTPGQRESIKKKDNHAKCKGRFQVLYRTCCFLTKNICAGVPIMAQWLMNPTGSHEVAGSIPGLVSGLGIRRYRARWCGLRIQLRSCVAVALAQAGGYSSDQTPSLGASTCRGCGPRKKQKDKKKKKKHNNCAPVICSLLDSGNGGFYRERDPMYHLKLFIAL